jgi:hypothetical protein
MSRDRTKWELGNITQPKDPFKKSFQIPLRKQKLTEKISQGKLQGY